MHSEVCKSGLGTGLGLAADSCSVVACFHYFLADQGYPAAGIGSDLDATSEAAIASQRLKYYCCHSVQIDCLADCCKELRCFGRMEAQTCCCHHQCYHFGPLSQREVDCLRDFQRFDCYSEQNFHHCFTNQPQMGPYCRFESPLQKCQYSKAMHQKDSGLNFISYCFETCYFQMGLDLGHY